ncbi:gamma-type small acid-soluble spore protein, partial [Bacillus pseudomycoides]|uniref:gamma-type small acid-soluble spore protein n=1 Tax=Bacillus pseudomycoides TaxID=64104 RepID=UPI0028481F6E
QGYNEAPTGTSIQNTNASYGTEFATKTNEQAGKQQNAQSEEKTEQASSAGVQSANASYGTEFATDTDVQAEKQQHAQSAAKKSQPSSTNQ